MIVLIIWPCDPVTPHRHNLVIPWPCDPTTLQPSNPQLQDSKGLWPCHPKTPQLCDHVTHDPTQTSIELIFYLRAVPLSILLDVITGSHAVHSFRWIRDHRPEPQTDADAEI